MSLKEQIDRKRLPRHIAIIMDGNGRWAKKKGKLRIFGHEHGVKAVRRAVETAADLGVEYLTLYAFSTENWKRPKIEVDALMHLLVKTIHKEVESLHKNGVSLKAIGNMNSLPEDVRKELELAIEKTKDNKRLTLILALSYSSKWEILEATKKIAAKVKEGDLDVDSLDFDAFSAHLETADYPDPELLVRTSGEIRISNFLLWQIAYSELYFTDKLWPDFDDEELYKAILSYQNRERRFGKTSEQLGVIK